MRIILATARVEQEEREIMEAARAIVEGTLTDVEEPTGEPPEGVESDDETRNVLPTREANAVAGAASGDNMSEESVATLASLSIESQPLTQCIEQSTPSINADSPVGAAADRAAMTSGAQLMTDLPESTSGSSGAMSKGDIRLHSGSKLKFLIQRSCPRWPRSNTEWCPRSIVLSSL